MNSLLANRPSPLTPFLVASVGGHVGLVIIGLVLSWLYDTPRIDLDQKPIVASLVRLGKKREEQLLPRKEEAPPPEEQAVPIPTPGVKAEPPKPQVKTQTEKKTDSKKSLFDALNKTATPEELEGDENGDPKGDSAKQEGEKYYGVIKSAVHRYYDVSNTIPESERIQLKADVAIRLDAEGGLIDMKFVTESSNDTFNNAVLAAIKKAAPFGPPPPALRAALKKDGVQLRFTP